MFSKRLVIAHTPSPLDNKKEFFLLLLVSRSPCQAKMRANIGQFLKDLFSELWYICYLV